jgi:hypothetical protein
MEQISYFTYEGQMAREERKQQRLWIALILETIVALIAIFKR